MCERDAYILELLVSCVKEEKLRTRQGERERDSEFSDMRVTQWHGESSLTEVSTDYAEFFRAH